MKSKCGADCSECKLYNKKCKGCIETKGCPFSKKCFIASYIEIGGESAYNKMKRQLINEFNSLNIDGMKKVKELNPINGTFVNLDYRLPNGVKTKFLRDNDIYLGNQIESMFNDEDTKRYYGLVANMDFLLVCEYDENGNNRELLVYKKR